MISLSPWWRRWPERLEHELEALWAAGVDFDDPVFDEDRGVVTVRFRRQVRGENFQFRAHFPSFYPYTRFEVVLEGDPLPRHMHPFRGNLCLLGRDTSNWELNDTLASFIEDRIPRVFEAATPSDLDRAAELEEHQGEPFSTYYTYAEGSLLLIDGSWEVSEDHAEGRLEVAWLSDRSSDQLRGVALRLLDVHGGELGVSERSLHRLAEGRPVESIPWVKLPEPPARDDPQHIRRLVAERLSSGTAGQMVAVTFPEEVRWRQLGHGWILVTSRRGNGEGRQRTRVGGGSATRREIIRVQRAGASDLAERSPEFQHLQEKRVAVFGLGALGSPAAVSLARAGLGELRLVDDDVVDAGTVVRWELGLNAAGHPKVTLASYINQGWPHTNAVAYRWRVGDPFGGDLPLMERVLDGVDLVFDATAQVGIQHLLFEMAAELGIPYLAVTSTYGGHGGLVLRLHPAHTEACWVCHRLNLETGAVDAPPADPEGTLQPAGCAEPTFTGSNLDLELVANQAARTAVDTLLYPDRDDEWWEVAITGVRTPNRHPTLPNWQTHRLAPHPRCKNTHPRWKKGGEDDA